MKDGFVRVAAISPDGRVANPTHNVESMVSAAMQAAEGGAKILVFPELCVSAYTCADLFFQSTLLREAEAQTARFIDQTCRLDAVCVIGAPVTVNGRLYSCALVTSRGKLLGIVPKSTIPSHGAYTEGHYFASAPTSTATVSFAGQSAPFGTDLLFVCDTLASLVLAAEVGYDAHAPLTPSTRHALAGATVIVHPDATPTYVGTREKHESAVLAQTERLSAAYISAGAGSGESTTDLVFSAYRLVAQCGTRIACSAPFDDTTITYAVIDTDMLASERRRRPLSSRDAALGYTTVPFSLDVTETACVSPAPRFPFVPSDPTVRAERCALILAMQARALAARMERSHAKTAVIGVSGGLDSTLALLVCTEAMDLLKRPRTDILAVTMPCFGTTSRTKSNAQTLSEALGTTLRTVDIKASVTQHLKDIAHSDDIHDVVYENAQARERTQVLMDIANAEGGLVVGTGDLSELALGWATYNGDHMSMYAVNASVPKTLIRHLVAYCADEAEERDDRTVSDVLRDILATPVSPELLPPKDGEIAQCTEDIVGPYELHDYFLYYTLRFGYSPTKLDRMAKETFRGVYDEDTVHGWLRVFMRRFLSQQFKRSCLPDGPKVGSVGVSPRGDLRMPSDADGTIWMDF